MGRFHLLVSWLKRGDGIGTDLFGMKECLEEAGHEVHVYADNFSKFRLRWHRPERFLTYSGNQADTLIYHFGAGWDTGLEILKAARTRKIIKYHNVTPPEFFAPYSPSVYRNCEDGRRQIREIAKMGCDLYLSPSQYNSSELILEGAPEEKCAVIPNFTHIDRVAGLKADQETIRKYSDGKVNILMVGRVSPNKGHKKLLEAFSRYHRLYEPESRLLVVGSISLDFRKYVRELRQMMKKLEIEHAVEFMGKVSEAKLKAFYQISHALVMLSGHEGLCHPLLEAMYFKLPIIAYGSSAIPETLGASALHWDTDDPSIYAASLDTIIKDHDLKNTLVDLQCKRYEETFSTTVIKKKFLELISAL